MWLQIIEGLKELPSAIKLVLEQDAKIQDLAEELFDKKSMLMLGRGYSYATCLEGSLKIKELTHLHSEGMYSIM